MVWYQIQKSPTPTSAVWYQENTAKSSFSNSPILIGRNLKSVFYNVMISDVYVLGLDEEASGIPGSAGKLRFSISYETSCTK